MRRREHVYILADPRDGVVRYVGLTESPRRRRAEHRRACACPANACLCDWERRMRATGRRIELRVIETVVTYDPEYGNIAGRKAETFWIDYFRRIGAPLLNKT